jgi:hypothetical protein
MASGAHPAKLDAVSRVSVSVVLLGGEGRALGSASSSGCAFPAWLDRDA